jgi:hypothetical protein
MSGRIAEQVRIRVLRRFARSGLIEPDDVREMLAWQNSGFLLGTASQADTRDHAELERPKHFHAPPRDVRFLESCRRSWPRRRCLVMAYRSTLAGANTRYRSQVGDNPKQPPAPDLWRSQCGRKQSH